MTSMFSFHSHDKTIKYRNLSILYLIIWNPELISLQISVWVSFKGVKVLIGMDGGQ